MLRPSMLLVSLLLAMPLVGPPAPVAAAGHGHQTTVRLESDADVLVSGPGIDGTRQANVCSTRPSPWARPLSGSTWIGVVSSCTDGVSTGDFRYTATFTLGAD